MARIIMLLAGAIITILALPMYFLLCLWIALFEEYERRRRKEKEDGKSEKSGCNPKNH